MARDASLQTRLDRRGLLCVITTLAIVAGCAQQLTPQDVADRFWRAVITRHPAKIRRYVLSEDRKLLKGESDLLPISDFRLGRILIDGDTANIETRVTLDGDTPVPINIETKLVRENNVWLVNYAATANEITVHSNLSQVIGKIGAIGDALKDGIEQSVEEMTQALPAIKEELARIESEIKQHIPELREKLEIFSKRIEEALKAPPAAASPDENPTIAL